MTNQKNRFFTLVFSCCPGAGEMYMGLYRQGVSLMGLFFGTIALAAWLGFEELIFFICPIVWCYSFFHTHNLRRMTEEEFAQTKEYLKRIHFYEMHIFKYSRRQGTRAAVMEHQVPEEIKTKRSAQLLALAESMSREFRAYYVGKEEEVLFEEPMEVDGETWYTGYTKEYVKIAAKTEEPLDNVMKRGRVEAALTDEIYRMKL